MTKKYGVFDVLSRADSILQKREFLSSIKKISDQRLEVPYSLKKSSFFFEEGNLRWIVCIKLDFMSEEVSSKKYQLCVSEVKLALLSVSCFQAENIKNDGLYIFAVCSLWKSIVDKYKDYKYYCCAELAKTIVNVSTVLEVLDMIFIAKGFEGVKGKIGVLCGKGLQSFEDSIFKECINGHDKIFMDEDAYGLTLEHFKDPHNFYFDEFFCCYRGDILSSKSIDLARKYIENYGSSTSHLNFEEKNVKNSNAGLVSEKDGSMVNSICPICNGDGGVRGGCLKCDGSGWVSEISRSSRSFFAEKNHGCNDNSRISNSDYGSMHQGAHYRDADGRFGSIPDYDMDE